jgi:hypothetical protein
MFILFSILTQCYAEEPAIWKPSKILTINYPRIPWMARIQGTVEAKCKINEDGTVKDIKCSSKGSANNSKLIPAVKDNLIHWIFKHSCPKQLLNKNKIFE